MLRGRLCGLLLLWTVGTFIAVAGAARAEIAAHQGMDSLPAIPSMGRAVVNFTMTSPPEGGLDPRRTSDRASRAEVRAGGQGSRSGPREQILQEIRSGYTEAERRTYVWAPQAYLVKQTPLTLNGKPHPRPRGVTRMFRDGATYLWSDGAGSASVQPGNSAVSGSLAEGLLTGATTLAELAGHPTGQSPVLMLGGDPGSTSRFELAGQRYYPTGELVVKRQPSAPGLVSELSVVVAGKRREHAVFTWRVHPKFGFAPVSLRVTKGLPGSPLRRWHIRVEKWEPGAWDSEFLPTFSGEIFVSDGRLDGSQQSYTMRVGRTFPDVKELREIAQRSVRRAPAPRSEVDLTGHFRLLGIAMAAGALFWLARLRKPKGGWLGSPQLWAEGDEVESRR